MLKALKQSQHFNTLLSTENAAVQEACHKLINIEAAANPPSSRGAGSVKSG
jgi:hypothetical protein